MNGFSAQAVERRHGQSEFCVWLAGDRASLRKGERTRKDLMVTCAELLASEPFDRLTVSGLCKAAGVAHGTFYVYFDNLNTLLAEVLGYFVDYVQIHMRSAARQGGDPVRATTAAYYALFKANAGLMKCLVIGIDAFPEARAAFQRLNNEWAKTVVYSVKRQNQAGHSAEDEMMRRAYALGGMVDQYLTGLFVAEDPWIASISQDSEAVISTLTDIWMKGMKE
ncbi:transcriptional regulator, TetR family [Thalassovita litoralis]|jgi:AcrR family transcriptional regulator|uniref:Transcriptional regulator, TetR family n=1 Tax=Thalassovita litoralis TaxID=1010611 RepID=A0A521CW91_9RHOB|nr:TetR/AcrR family transcriptional regulator [Thalassovita litoralis]SMO63707.1 transcriptional regulator, TetR family [Thalassovita litoralis]